MLQPAGYVSASIGKWHLGGPEFRPEMQGFALNVAGTDRGQPPSYFSPYKISTIADGPAGEYLTDREADEAIKFVEASREKPFLLYWPRHAVHTPLQAKPELIEKYRRKAEKMEGPQNNPTYAAMIESLDDSIGRLVSKLGELGLAERTVIFFTSDNGGLTIQKNGGPTSNLGLRAGKGSTYEGGTRVPLIVRWSRVVAAGSTCDVPVMSIDYLPTMREIAGVAQPAAPSPPTPLPRRGEGSVDGVSLVPLLKQSGSLARDTLYWHYPHYHPGGATPYSAIRQGDWKLIEFHEDGRRELFNLKDDPAEKQNVANQMTPRVAELAAKLDSWRKNVGGENPRRKPGFILKIKKELTMFYLLWLVTGFVAVGVGAFLAKRLDK
jgi:arylsulfatase A-like enzyme